MLKLILISAAFADFDKDVLEAAAEEAGKKTTMELREKLDAITTISPVDLASITPSSASFPVLSPPPPIETSDALSLRLATILNEVKLQTCGDVAACWRRQALRLYDALNTGVQGLQLRFKLQATSDETIGIIKVSMQMQNSALQMVSPLLQKPDSFSVPWWQHPTLWVAVGLFLGAGATIGVAAAIHWVVH